MLSKAKKVAIVALAAVAVAAICAAVIAASYGSVAFEYDGSDVNQIRFKDFTMQDVIRLTGALFVYPVDGGSSLMSAAARLIDSVGINATVNASNSGLLPVSIGGFSFDILADGARVGNGSYAGTVTVASGANAAIFISLDLDFAAMSNATVLALTNNGTAGIIIEGRAQVGLFGTPFSIEIQINMKDAIRDAIADYLSGD